MASNMNQNKQASSTPLGAASGSDRHWTSEEWMQAMESMTEAIRQAAKGLFELHASLCDPTHQNQEVGQTCVGKEPLDGLQASQATPQET